MPQYTIQIFNKQPQEVHHLLEWIYENINSYIKGRVLEFGNENFTISSLITSQDDAMSKFFKQKINEEHILQTSETRREQKVSKNITLSNPDFDQTYFQKFQIYDTVIAIDILTNGFYTKKELENANKFLKKDGHFITIIAANTVTFMDEEVDIEYLKKQNSKSAKNYFAEYDILKTRLFHIADNANFFPLLAEGLATLTIARKQ